MPEVVNQWAVASVCTFSPLAKALERIEVLLWAVFQVTPEFELVLIKGEPDWIIQKRIQA